MVANGHEACEYTQVILKETWKWVLVFIHSENKCAAQTLRNRQKNSAVSVNLWLCSYLCQHHYSDETVFSVAQTHFTFSCINYNEQL